MRRRTSARLLRREASEGVVLMTSPPLEVGLEGFATLGEDPHRPIL